MSKRSGLPGSKDAPPPMERVLAGVSLHGDGSLTQQVYRLLRDCIVRLVLLPNQFISEKDVAACLDISKTPVREAFIRLAEDGIVDIVPKSGTYVSSIDIDRAMEGFFIWSALESSCARQAAERHGMDNIGHLRDLLAEEMISVRAGDVAGFMRTSILLHEVIMDMADMSDSGKVIEIARFEVDRALALCAGQLAQVLSAAYQDHLDLVNAIALHKTDAAAEAIERHVNRFQNIVSDPACIKTCASLNHKRTKTRRQKETSTDLKERV